MAVQAGEAEGRAGIAAGTGVRALLRPQPVLLPVKSSCLNLSTVLH